ncbi:uncharacterized protein V1516DRAFT_662042 [Lipomyces oligophaga]|uniref:uncharacterized protein n=1 Tax=Lipomyces oligophaga TaxID=45792 RepID=UPI0034CE9971
MATLHTFSAFSTNSPSSAAAAAAASAAASAHTASTNFSSMQAILQLASAPDAVQQEALTASMLADQAGDQKLSRRPRKQFICRHCSVVFKRGEHLARHERSHTAERPFACPRCSRGFTRKDLLVRHLRMCKGPSSALRKERRRSIIQRVIIRPNEVDPPTSGASTTSIVGTTANSSATTGDLRTPPHMSEPYLGKAEIQPRVSNICWPNESFLHFLGMPADDSSSVSPNSTSTSSSPSCSSINSAATVHTLSQSGPHLITTSATSPKSHIASPPCSPSVTTPLSASALAPGGPSVLSLSPSLLTSTSTALGPLSSAAGALEDAVSATASQFALSMQDWSYLEHQFGLPDLSSLLSSEDLASPQSTRPSPPTQSMANWFRLESACASPTATSTLPMLPPTPSLLNSNSNSTVHPPSPASSPSTDSSFSSRSFSESTTSSETFRQPSVQSHPPVWIVPFDDLCRQAMVTLLSPLIPRKDFVVFDTFTMQRYLSVYVINFSHHFPIIHPSVFKFQILKDFASKHSSGYSIHDRNHPDFPWEALSTALLCIVMATNGAVYSLAHKDARVLRNWARKLLSVLPSEASLPDERRLALIQSRLIISGFDAWSGDDQLTQVALDEQAFFQRFCILALKRRRERVTSTWKEWINRESIHRLYWGVYVVMSDYNITFHQSLPLKYSDRLMLPDHQILWQAESESEWRAMLDSCPPPSTVSSVVTSVFDDPICRIDELLDSNSRNSNEAGKAQNSENSDGGSNFEDNSQRTTTTEFIADPPLSEDETAMRIIYINKVPHVLSLFSVYITMHVIMNQIWNAGQVLQLGSSGSRPSTSRMQGLHQLRLFTFQQAERILTQSAKNLAESQAEFAKRVPGACSGVPLSPMIFNACSLVRVMQIRLFKSSSALNNLLCDPDMKINMNDALEEFLDVRPEMGSLVDKALEDAVVGLEVQVKAGPAMIKRLAPVYWNVEHALCGWDSNLFLSRWLHEIEIQIVTQSYDPTPSELSILQRVQKLLRHANILKDDAGAQEENLNESEFHSDAATDPVDVQRAGLESASFYSSLSLSAAMVEFCSDLLDDTWVWGVSVKMALILRQLGKKYRMRHLQSRVMNIERRGSLHGSTD